MLCHWCQHQRCYAAKRGFYRAANNIFGKVRRVVYEEVIIQLILNKCMPIGLLMYGLEACRLNKSDIISLDFVVNRFFMKIPVQTAQ